MTPEIERIGRILVEAEGGHWHNNDKVLGGILTCSKCDYGVLKTTSHNPDFSDWQHFGRLLKIAGKKGINIRIWNYSCSVMKTPEKEPPVWFEASVHDQIPALVATTLAEVIENGKG